jgi:hypothetical protein
MRLFIRSIALVKIRYEAKYESIGMIDKIAIDVVHTLHLLPIHRLMKKPIIVISNKGSIDINESCINTFCCDLENMI